MRSRRKLTGTSTHERFNREAQSALALKDSAPLSMGDLFETEQLGHPRLVVLSACETGLYESDRTPDEFIGLPGAFMSVGAVGGWHIVASR
jgi:CHAT domain-containing protein